MRTGVATKVWMQPVRITRLVERWETAVTKAVLERARWRCESCRSDSELRVVEDRRDNFYVLCLSCRLDSAWVSTVRSAHQRERREAE
jgi:hypothetical protein